MLRRNFDVECAYVILRHNVDYRGSMSRLPILVFKREPTREGGRPMRLELYLFEGVKKLMKLAEILLGNPFYWAACFQRDSLPWPSGTTCQLHEILCSGGAGVRICKFTKRE